MKKSMASENMCVDGKRGFTRQKHVEKGQGSRVHKTRCGKNAKEKRSGEREKKLVTYLGRKKHSDERKWVEEKKKLCPGGETLRARKKKWLARTVEKTERY